MKRAFEGTNRTGCSQATSLILPKHPSRENSTIITGTEHGPPLAARCARRRRKKARDATDSVQPHSSVSDVAAQAQHHPRPRAAAPGPRLPGHGVLAPPSRSTSGGPSYATQSECGYSSMAVPVVILRQAQRRLGNQPLAEKAATAAASRGLAITASLRRSREFGE